MFPANFSRLLRITSSPFLMQPQNDHVTIFS